MIGCSMLFGTDYILSLHFHNDKIAWKYRKTANIIEKTSLYTVSAKTAP